MNDRNGESDPRLGRGRGVLVPPGPPPLRYPVAEIIQSGQGVRRRRRTGWMTSGVPVVAAVGVVAAVAVPSLTRAAVPPTTVGPAGPSADLAASTDAAPAFPVAAQPFTFSFDGYRVGRLRVAQPIDVSTAYELASVYADGLTTNDRPADPNQPPPTRQVPTLYGYLTVYRPGAYIPWKLANAHRVSVAGRPGLEVDDTAGGWAAKRTLAWQYGTNAWAVINAGSTGADYPSAEDVRRLAAGLRPATPRAAKVPFTMTYVPPGYHLDEVAMHAMTGLDGIAVAREGDYAGLLFSRPAQPTIGLTAPFGGVDGADPPGSFNVFVVPAGPAHQEAPPHRTP